MMKTFNCNVTLVTKHLPEDQDLIVKVLGPTNLLIIMNETRVYNVLAMRNQILGALNSQFKKLVEQTIQVKALQEDQLNDALQAQEKADASKSTSKSKRTKRS